MNNGKILVLFVFGLVSCTKPVNQDSFSDERTPINAGAAVDTVGYGSVESLNPTAVPIPDTANKSFIIRYGSDAYRKGQQFEPFNDVYAAAGKVRGAYGSTPADTTSIAHLREEAYKKILAYEQKLKSGITVAKSKARFLEGQFYPDDESQKYLPESSSTTFDDLDFMFMGGAPFFHQDEELYKDPDGNPEAHYLIVDSDNGQGFFNYAFSRHPGPIELSYGPPLTQVYEGPPVQIHGIGSLTHHLTNRIPVWFLTTIGPVPASLISVKMKLAEEYGCISSYPLYTFACGKNISPQSIFGVFYSADPFPIEKAVSMYQQRGSVIWEYDLDGDTLIDVVRVNTVNIGEASGSDIAKAIWFVRINNQWVVLDHAEIPDCT